MAYKSDAPFRALQRQGLPAITDLLLTVTLSRIRMISVAGFNPLSVRLRSHCTSAGISDLRGDGLAG
jgi:hypothetical protein